MNKIAFVVVVIGCALAAAGCMSERYAYRTRSWAPDTAAMLSKQDIINMSKAGVGDTTIIDLMTSTGSHFRLRAQDVVELADSGVSDHVISAMINTQRPPRHKVVRERYYYSSPPYSWYYGYPFWDPWYYSAFYPGYWWNSYYYYPYGSHMYYGSGYHTSGPAYHDGGRGRGSGGTRTSGRRR